MAANTVSGDLPWLRVAWPRTPDRLNRRLNSTFARTMVRYAKSWLGLVFILIPVGSAAGQEPDEVMRARELIRASEAAARERVRLQKTTASVPELLDDLDRAMSSRPVPTLPALVVVERLYERGAWSSDEVWRQIRETVEEAAFSMGDQENEVVFLALISVWFAMDMKPDVQELDDQLETGDPYRGG